MTNITMGSIIFDGNLQNISDALWNTIYYSDGSIAGYGYSATTAGSHTITHPKPAGKVFVSIYGWTTYGGYSYDSGMFLNPINPNFVPPEITFTRTEFVVSEGNGTVYVYLERLKEFTSNVSVTFYVSPILVDTAVDSEDYVSTSVIVNFTAGKETVKYVTIPIIDDQSAEPTEYFSIVIEPLEGDVTFPLNEAVVAITDDDSVTAGLTSNEFYIVDNDTTLVSIGIINGWIQSGYTIDLSMNIEVDGVNSTTISIQLSSFNKLIHLKFELSEISSFNIEIEQNIISRLWITNSPVELWIMYGAANIITPPPPPLPSPSPSPSSSTPSPTFSHLMSTEVTCVTTITSYSSAQRNSTVVSTVTTRPAVGTTNALTKDISVSSGGLYFGIAGVIVAVIVILVVSFFTCIVCYYYGQRKGRTVDMKDPIDIEMSGVNELYDNTVPGYEYDNESLGSLPAFAEDKDGLIYEYLQ